MNQCNRCKYGILGFWGCSSRYDYYNSCPYSTHSHYARKACNFFEEGDIPFCPRHGRAMRAYGTHGDVTVYRCFEHGREMCREVWVHKNGLKRIVDKNLDPASLFGKSVLKHSFDIVESTKINNWE